MNIAQTRRCQRGVSAWTMLGCLLIVAGVAGLGVTWFKPFTSAPAVAESITPDATPAASAGNAAAPSMPGANLAAASAALTISNAGLGDAKFGMDLDAVERLIGRPLVLPNGKSREQVRGMACSYAGVKGLDEVMLRFERGQFMAVDVNKPTVATRSGFKVGDPEKALIDKLKGDPTYHRESNHYDDAIMEITVGKLEMVDIGGQQTPSGWLLKFSSEEGHITHIQAGAASYVSLVEHEEDCER